MKTRYITGALIAVLGVGFAFVYAQAPPATTTTTATSANIAEEGLIRKTADAYSAAFNKGDLAAVMSIWADDCEYVNEDGKAVKGKAAVSELMKKVCSAENAAKCNVKVKTTSLRLVSPNVALHDGNVEMKAEGETIDGPFTAVWVKNGANWQLSRVRDLPSDAGPATQVNYASLRQLEWLVGNWESDDEKKTVSLNVKWTKNKSFLHLEQTVKLPGDETLTVTGIIGWDPINEIVRSWVFDSNGGFGEGEWDRVGNSWQVAANGVQTDGKTASSMNLWKYLDENNFEWVATERQIDDQPVADARIKYRKIVAK